MFFVEILLIALLLFLFAISWRAQPPQRPSPDEKILTEISSNLDKISQELNIKPSYNLYSTEDKTCVVDKKDIYLILRDSSNKLYDKNTLHRAAIHELAHILCPHHGHGGLFPSIEKNLLQIAVDKKICTQHIDKNYPCMDDDES
jgi:hypothetical protein